MADPVIGLIQQCQRCGQPMGTLRVYKGKGDPQHEILRGSLVQTCINKSCNFTKFHTQPYNFQDAEALVQRVLNPSMPVINPALRPPSPPSPPSLSQAGKIFCANEQCFTKIRGIRTQGHKLCIEKKCINCCKIAYSHALTNHLRRERCSPHGQSEVVSNTYQVYPSQTAPTHTPSITSSTPIPTASGTQSMSSLTQSLTPSTVMASIITPALGALPSTLPQPKSQIPSNISPYNQDNDPLPAIQPPALNKSTTVSNSGNTTSNPLGSASQRPRAKPLAQPLNSDWAKPYDESQREKQRIKSLKIQQQEIDAQKRRTCLLVVYFKNGQPPLKLKWFVETFPNLCLSDVKDLVADAHLTPSSCIDLYNGEPWTTITINTVIPVECDQRVLLRLRPSLLETLSDCPGIDREIELQPSRRPLNNKRAAQVLVSPLKKIPKTDTEIDVSSTRPPSPHYPNHPPSPHSAAISATPPHCQSVVISKRSTASQAITKRPNEQKPNQRKMWPLDYSVLHYSLGTTKLEAFRQAKKTEKDSFALAFNGIEYKKTTVCKYKKLWQDASKALKEKYISYGDTSAGLFSKFKTELERQSLSRSPSPVLKTIQPLESSTSNNNTETDELERQSLSQSSSSVLSTIQPSESSIHNANTKTDIIPTSINNTTFIHEHPDSISDTSMDDICLISSDNLCPFCDRPMEIFRSGKLDAMLGALWKLTNRDPTPQNKNHRSPAANTPTSQIIIFCNLHRLESTYIPLAHRNGWPMKIDFSQLFERIKYFEEEILGMAESIEECSFYNETVSVVANASPKHARKYISILLC